MHPKERKILQRKFARGLELILSSLEELAKQGQGQNPAQSLEMLPALLFSL